MPVETELKLRIAPADLQRLKNHPFLRSISCQRAVRRELNNIYFDTPDMQLKRQKIALRLRRVGQQWLQTMKSGGEINAGLHSRNEWETTVTDGQLDFAALEAIGAPCLPSRLRKKLRPVFNTDFMRSVRLVKFGGAKIELSLDYGEVKAGKRLHQISELELELKSGKPLQLFRLALALLDIVPLQLENTSKAEYGYRLFNGERPSVLKAQRPELAVQDSVTQALQTMLWSCMFHLQANVAGVIQQDAPEYLHQVRVALRRLRAALNMAANFRPDKELEALRQRIVLLGNELGAAREWDVFLSETLPRLLNNAGKNTGLKNLQRECEQRRQASYRLIQESLDGKAFQRLLLDFASWMYGRYWRKPGKSGNIVLFAQQILEARQQKVWRRAKNGVAGDDPEQLHKLRIACKNLRYSASLLSTLGEQVVGSKLNALSKLQDILGKMNDATTASVILTELQSNMTHTSFLRVSAAINRNRSVLLDELSEEWKKFSGE